MKKLILTSLILLTCLYAQAQQSALTVKPAKIQAGKEVQFTYTGKLAKEGTIIRAGLIGIKFNSFKPVETKLSGKQLIGKFIVPDSIAYVIFEIKKERRQKELFY